MKDRSPMVSVIIPTYNGEKYIQQAIDSVLNQSFQDFEIIISDDNSTDKTREIIQGYKTDPRISFFQNEKRLGIGGNWNHGIEQSKGKYIKILCQDDVLMYDYLKETIQVLEKFDNVSIATSEEEFFGEFERVKNRENLPEINRDSKLVSKTDGNKAQQTILQFGNWIGGPTSIIFRSKDFKNIGPFNESLTCSLDWEYWLRLLAVGDLYVIPNTLFKTRLHGSQESNNCIRKLGFRKERIQILHAVKSEPQSFGKQNLSELSRLLDVSMLQLLEAATNSSDVTLWDASVYLKKYTTVPKMFFILSKFLGIKVFQKLSGK